MFLIVLLIFITALGNGISENNLVYAVEQIHEYDRSLFLSNIFMAEGTISAKYFLNKVLSAFMHITGGNWQNVAVPYIYLGVVVLAVSVLSVTYRITEKNRNLISVIIAFTILVNICGQVGGYTLFTNSLIESIRMGMGFAVATLGISFVVWGGKRIII